MKQINRSASKSIARLIPRENPAFEGAAFSKLSVARRDYKQDDLICAGLEELSRHLKWLDNDYQSCRFERLEARGRSIVMLADQLGLRCVGQVAADVVFCVASRDETALAATLSRLMRLVTQALDQAAGPRPVF